MGTYSPQDYVVYIAMLLGIMWLLQKYLFPKIKLDKNFVYAIAPYMLIGTFIRLLVDVCSLPRSQMWSVTPGVYILTMALALFFMGLGLYAERRHKIPYWQVMLAGGIIALLPLTYELSTHLIHPDRIAEPISLASGMTLLVYLCARAMKSTTFIRHENVAIVFAHLLDGCATYVAYDKYGFGEEHLLPKYLIEFVGDSAFIMIPAKLLLILFVVYYIERWRKQEGEKEETTYRVIKILLFILGIGPGIRDALLPALELCSHL